jgi:hypothetical protein
MSEDPIWREARLLKDFCRKAQHYALREPGVCGQGAHGIVFVVECVHPDAPVPGKLYALKMRFSVEDVSSSRLSSVFQPEWQAIALLPPHPNLNRFLVQFMDDVPDSMFALVPPESDLRREGSFSRRDYLLHSVHSRPSQMAPASRRH